MAATTDESKNTVNKVEIKPQSIFGETEDIKQISPAEVCKILKDAGDLPATTPVRLLRAQVDIVVLRVAMLIFGNADRPHDITCTANSKKTNDAVVHTKGGSQSKTEPRWEIIPLELAAVTIVKTAIRATILHQPWEDPDATKWNPMAWIKGSCANLMRYIINNESEIAATFSRTMISSLLSRNKALLKNAGRYSTVT